MTASQSSIIRRSSCSVKGKSPTASANWAASFIRRSFDSVRFKATTASVESTWPCVMTQFDDDNSTASAAWFTGPRSVAAVVGSWTATPTASSSKISPDNTRRLAYFSSKGASSGKLEWNVECPCSSRLGLTECAFVGIVSFVGPSSLECCRVIDLLRVVVWKGSN